MTQPMIENNIYCEISEALSVHHQHKQHIQLFKFPEFYTSNIFVRGSIWQVYLLCGWQDTCYYPNIIVKICIKVLLNGIIIVKKNCFMAPFCALFRLNWANQSSGHEWCIVTSVPDIGRGRTHDPAICSPVPYIWTTTTDVS